MRAEFTVRPPAGVCSDESKRIPPRGAVQTRPHLLRNARYRERSATVRLWRLVRTRRPVTFSEKVKYKMLRDRRDLVVTFADKAAVRDYVASAIGDQYLPALHALVDDSNDLLTCALPTDYVVKPTHGSGAVIVVSGRADPRRALPQIEACWAYTHIHSDRVDRRRLAAITRYWLEQLYGQGPNREWAYGRVPRRIIVEELLTGPHGGVADDYKLFVFHGRCQFIQVDTGRFGVRTQDFYRRPWDRLPLSGGLPAADRPQPPPARLNEMVALAERLAQPTDFLRVDLYLVEERIIVGELTSYPAGGNSPFYPASFDAEFGRFWTVPKRYDEYTN
jgi:hypothetical protein